MQQSRVHSKVGDSGRKGSGWAALSQQTRGVQDPNQKTFSYVDGSGNRKAPDLSSDYPELPSSTGGATTPKTRSAFCRPTCLTVILVILGLMLVSLRVPFKTACKNSADALRAHCNTHALWCEESTVCISYVKGHNIHQSYTH